MSDYYLEREPKEIISAEFQKRTSSIVRAFLNLDRVLVDAYGEKQPNSFDEQVERLNPNRQAEAVVEEATNAAPELKEAFRDLDERQLGTQIDAIYREMDQPSFDDVPVREV